MTKQQAVEKLLGAEYVYAAFSQVTKHPFVTCDEETFNDQIWIFSTEGEIQEFAKGYTERKILLAACKIPREKLRGFYTGLYAIGVNTVLYNEKEEKTEVELTELVPPPDFSGYPKGQEPLFNPTLQLSGIYYMQELHRQAPAKEKPQLGELAEELQANLERAMYLLPGEPVDEKNMKIPYIKTKDGDRYQVVFTDIYEYQRFSRGKKFRLAKLSFRQLFQQLLPEAKGYVINPQGIHLLLQKTSGDAVVSSK